MAEVFFVDFPPDLSKINLSSRRTESDRTVLPDQMTDVCSQAPQWLLSVLLT